jgi:hypothetical protein
MRPTDSDPGDSSPSARAGPGSRRPAALSRWLHIYVSMVSFGILLFFAVTGFTLNHAEALFGTAPVPREVRGTLNPAWVRGPSVAEVARLEIVEHLRRQHGVRGLVGEFRTEEATCTIAFKGPGYAADASVDRASGRYELRETRMGFIAVINDLHKGRDTGAGWSLIVDLSAALMVVVSVSGLVLILFIKRRLKSGLVTAAVGTLASWLAYLWLVP